MLSISKRDRNDLDLEEAIAIGENKKAIKKLIHKLLKHGIEVDSLPKKTKLLFNRVFQKEVLGDYKVDNLKDLLRYSNELIHDLCEGMHYFQIEIPLEVMILQQKKTKK